MNEIGKAKGFTFWLALSILVVTIILIIAIQLHWFRLSAVIAGELSHHWVGWIGAVFIGIYLPLFSFLRRRHPRSNTTLLPIHVFGNLLAFASITVHYAHQLTRPARAFPTLGTGVALIITLVILVITGFALRFQLIHKGYKSWRWVHTAAVLSFYIIAIIHILHGAGIPGF